MSKQKENINQILDDIVHLNNQLNGLELLIKSKKQKVREYFEDSGESTIKNPEVSAFVTTRTNITYDIQAIKEKLDKDLYKQFVDRTHSLDLKAFKRICLVMNIDYKKFRKAIKVSETVNEEKLNKLYDIGEITLKDLDGCYDAKVSKSVSFRFFKSKEAAFDVKKEFD